MSGVHTVAHAINEASPLKALFDSGMLRRAMGADESDAGGEGGADTRRLSRLSIHAVVQAFDNVYGGDLSATRSYAKASVRFSAVFEDMIGMANGQMQISWDHFNTTIPLEVLEQRNAQGKEKRRQALLQGQRASGQDGGKGGKAIAVKVGPHPLTLTSHHSPLTTHLSPFTLTLTLTPTLTASPSLCRSAEPSHSAHGTCGSPHGCRRLAMALLAMALLAMALLAMALLAMALLTMALLAMALLAMALLAMALLTMALLTMALLTMAHGCRRLRNSIAS